MKIRNFLLLLVLVVIIGAIYIIERPTTTTLPSGETVDVGPTGGSTAKPEPGKPAPGFTLLDYQDEVHTLADYKGNKILLNFWASWCPFCVEEMPLFQTVYDEFKDQGFEIVAVNRGESQETARKFSDQLNLTYPLLLDQDDAVYGAYQGRSMPVSFLIDGTGMIVDRKFGPYNEMELRNKLKQFFGFSDEIDMPEDMPYKEPGEAVPTETFKPMIPMGEEPVIEEPLRSSRPISTTDDIKHSVPLEDIRGGGPPKDGIPSIDNPRFISVTEADEFVDDEGLGIAVSFDGVDRYYPFQILVWHEIVNDVIGGQSALVTYCPLCGTGTVFDPIVNGRASEFGTSGKLWNSNLVMYDRQTDSYWSQALGEAIVGEMTGAKLKLLAHDNLLYQDWKKDHPNGQVLSRETGHIRNYERQPYGDYATNDSVFFPVDNTDDRYHPKALMWGIEVGDAHQAYVLEELEKGPSKFSDEVGGVLLDITFDKANQTIDIQRTDNNQEVVPFFSFWFSWVAVHPDTGVWVAN